MKTYTIHFNRAKRSGEENLLVMEFQRERFTSREFKNYVLYHLFDLAGEGRGNKWLSAYICCDGEKVLTVRCHTETDGANITAVFYAARPREVFHKLRTMTIAA